MAKRKSDKQPPREPPEVAEEEPEAPDTPAAEEGQDKLVLAAREGGDELAGSGEQREDALKGDDLLDAEAGAEEEFAAGQLGTERYVMAGFFAAGMLAAYVLGRFVHGVWAYLSNKDWFSQTLPRLAAVTDDDKTTISLVVGGIAALILVLRTYRRPDIRTWSDEVAGELAKVKWPTKKEVSNSTIVVIAASTIATIYLALLDRLWGFITNLVYGDGS